MLPPLPIKHLNSQIIFEIFLSKISHLRHVPKSKNYPPNTYLTPKFIIQFFKYYLYKKKTVNEQHVFKHISYYYY
jgi:hypothetical protein